jgi:hypothetical protein
MKFLKILVVSAWSAIETFHPRPRYQSYEVPVAVEVLSKHYEVPTATVYLIVHALHASTCHIHLTSKDWFEWLFTFLLELLVYFVTLIKKVLNTKHVSVVSDSHASHTISYGMLNQIGNLALTIEQRIMCVGV